MTSSTRAVKQTRARRINPARFYFDERAATVAVRFFERLLKHSKGEWAGRPFRLEKWQRDQVIRPLFGWKRRSDGTRKYRRAYIEIPRKNGKSTIAAGIAAFLLFADNEAGAEVYSAAADKDQAAIVFDETKNMIEQSPELKRRSLCFKRAIYVPKTRSKYRVLSSDAFTKHGLNASGIIFDELHAQPSRELWDVLNTSTGSRRQPLMVMITTAGFDRESICFEQHEYARQILAGVIEDDEFFAFIAAADPKDDWLKPATWKKANPNYGVSVKADYLEAEAKRAKLIPAYQNIFKRLHLNLWTQQDTKWIDLGMWDLCKGPRGSLDLAEQLTGAECYAGLDLASSSDLAALLLAFPDDGDEEFYRFVARFWIPRDNMIERSHKDRVPYDLWAEQGLITVTDGNTIDYTAIMRDIEALGDKYHIQEVAFDRWGAFQIQSQLTAAGLVMVAFGQGFASMSPPTKDLYRLIQNKQIDHGNNPVLNWMADNVVVSMDPAGNIKPNKQKSRDHIDGIVAMIMSLDRAIRHKENQRKRRSVYEERGIRTI